MARFRQTIAFTLEFDETEKEGVKEIFDQMVASIPPDPDGIMTRVLGRPKRVKGQDPLFVDVKLFSLRDALSLIGRPTVVVDWKVYDLFPKRDYARRDFYLKHPFCVCCGKSMTHWLLKSVTGQYSGFFLPCHVSKDGIKIRLTKDHIIPKSKKSNPGYGGAKNYQTLCEPCNTSKGCSVISIQDLRERVGLSSDPFPIMLLSDLKVSQNDIRHPTDHLKKMIKFVQTGGFFTKESMDEWVAENDARPNPR